MRKGGHAKGKIIASNLVISDCASDPHTISVKIETTVKWQQRHKIWEISAQVCEAISNQQILCRHCDFTIQLYH